MKNQKPGRYGGLKALFYLLSFVFFTVCLIVVVLGISVNEHRVQLMNEKMFTYSSKDQCYDLDEDGVIDSQDVYKILKDWEGEVEADRLLGVMANWGTDCIKQ
jgi:hypothetical protein